MPPPSCPWPPSSAGWAISLAGTERRTLQSCPEAVQLAAQWQADLASPFACPVDRMPQPMAPAAPAAARRASAQPVQNPRWQSILAVLATVEEMPGERCDLQCLRAIFVFCDSKNLQPFQPRAVGSSISAAE